MKNKSYKLIVVRLIVISVFLIAYMSVKILNRKNMKTYGKVIVLNGPSGSGKSSIQKEFQYLMMLQPSDYAKATLDKSPKDGVYPAVPAEALCEGWERAKRIEGADRQTLWIKLGIDTLFDKPMPDINLENIQFWQSENPIRWVQTAHDEQGNPVITLFAGQQGEKVAYGMNSAIADYAKNGCNVIVDYIAYKKEWLDDLQTKLKDIKTYWVKVTLPLDIIEQREIARGTSPKGHARSHYDTVYWDLKYDLTVNSGIHSAKEIAQQVKEFVEGYKA